MSMDADYQALHNQVKDLHNHIRDAVGDHSHPSARVLDQEIQHLEDELEVQKNPRDIENRIKSIQHSLLEARDLPDSYMNFSHADHFYRTYEDMRRNMRNYHGY